MAMIETEGLTKTFPTRRGVVEAVRGVTMRVAEGEVYGFLGPNGAGKTTTLRILATLLQPTAGRAMVAGCDLLREPGRVRERIGYVSQVGGAERGATARENLVLQGRLYGMDRAAAVARASELIAAFELGPFADRLVRTYSGGQRRRLDLAMGLMHRPHLLFLDEPTTGLDPQSRSRLWDEVRGLRAAGTTVFLTTHYLEEADALCDRVAIIDGGRLVADDTPLALKRRISGDVITLGLAPPDIARARELLSPQPFVREQKDMTDGLQLYVERGEEVLPVVLRLLDQGGVHIRTVTLAHPSLDDVFLRLTGHSLREAEETNKG
jgi:ABC-2 type transport system ATP-binding protein